MSNLSSRKARWRQGDPMAEFDRLPPRLRAWLHQAALPWSAHSARKLWIRAMHETGCETAALARLHRAEQKCMERV